MEIQEILDERRQDYGEFHDVARVSQELKSAISVPGHYEADQAEALEMICSKMARIACGNPYHLDSWRDIAGYATLVANRLRDEIT